MSSRILSAEARVARLASRQFGVISSDELQAAGLSRPSIAVRARNGVLHRLYRGVYAVGHTGLTIEGRFLAAVKACGPAALLSHRAAAVVWSILEWKDCIPEVTVISGHLRHHTGIRVHRTRALAAKDRCVKGGVIPITSVARTLVDLSAVLGERQLRRAVRRAISKKLVTLPELVEALERTRPRRGSATLARILASGPVPTRTELEDVVYDLIIDGGFAPPDVNEPIWIRGRKIVPDFRWPDQKLIVEADGGAWHDHELAREDDAERQALLEAEGERVVRVTWDQAVAQRSQTLTRIRTAGAPVPDHRKLPKSA